MSNNDEQVSTIDKKLSEIPSKFISNDGNHSPSIFTIDNVLRKRHEAAYEPKMVSIGPYHRGKNNLQKMETLKWVYLKGILGRRNETSAHRYIDSLLQDEKKARTFYADHVPLNRQEFEEMMLLDGCFIIEFMRNYATKNNHNNDPIFKMKWMVEYILRDLLLFENQIPFFILDKLFGMTKISNNPTPADQEQHTSLISLAVSCLNDVINDKSSSSSVISQPENVFHLLILMYDCWCSSFTQSFTQLVQNGSTSNRNNRPPEFSCFFIGRKNPEDEDEEDLDDIMFIKNVTELENDKIKFVKSKQSTSWIDIKFENREIKIPPLVIQSCTEDVLRNLIAYEHYKFEFGYSGKFATDYTMFMDCLINTPMDVQKLRDKGIITNWLGNDQDVANMFNRMCNNAFLSPQNFTYRTHFRNVNKHCATRGVIFQKFVIDY